MALRGPICHRQLKNKTEPGRVLNPTGAGFKSSPFHLASSPASEPPAGLDPTTTTMLLGIDFSKWPCAKHKGRWLAWALAPAGCTLRPHAELPAPPWKMCTLKDKDISEAAYLLVPLLPELLPWNPRSGTMPAASADGCRKKQL